MERSKDWFEQAKRDLEVSKILFDTENYEWASFAAQQASEKALKAVLEKSGGESVGTFRLRTFESGRELFEY